MLLFSTGKHSSLQLRTRCAVDCDEDHGEYLISELASVTRHDNTNYVTSFGFASRNDRIPQQARIAMNREADKAVQSKIDNAQDKSDSDA